MKFIKLTDENGSVLVNVEDISVVDIDDGKTYIWMKSDPRYEVEVKETPEEIMALCTSTSA